MNRVWILHFTKRGGEEYIILLEQETKPTASEIRENQVHGYEPEEPICAELDDTGVLPFDVRLEKRH